MGSLYSGGVASGWCVYLLRNADGNVVYVGKGIPDRPVKHAKARGLFYEIAAANLHEQEALEIEARLIHLLGPVNLRNEMLPDWPGIEPPVALGGQPAPSMSFRLKGSRNGGKRHHGAKLSDAAVREIRAAPDTKAETFRLALKHDVSYSAITGCRKGYTYRNVL